MLAAIKKSPSINGITIPRRRFTAWAGVYFLLFFCLPFLSVCLVADLLFYLVFTRALDSCYGLLCLFA